MGGGESVGNRSIRCLLMFSFLAKNVNPHDLCELSCIS